MEIRLYIAACFILQFCTVFGEADSIRISSVRKIISLKNDHGIVLNVECFDGKLFTLKNQQIVPTVNSESNVCLAQDSNLYVFIYDIQGERIWPGYHFFCEKFYKGFASLLLTKQRLKICLLDYNLEKGNYRIQLYFYSDEFDLCLKSNFVEFEVE